MFHLVNGSIRKTTYNWVHWGSRENELQIQDVKILSSKTIVGLFEYVY